MHKESTEKIKEGIFLFLIELEVQNCKKCPELFLQTFTCATRSAFIANLLTF